MTDIFFSYSREDKDRVAFIAAALKAEGYYLWWDTDIAPGETYRGVTQGKLREAKCVVVVWSQTSVNSRWVIGEAEEGLHREILLPIMIDDVVRDIPIDFRSVQAANLTRWNGERSNHEWKRVLASVKRFVEQPAKPAQPYQKPKRASAGGGRAMTALALFFAIIAAGVGFLYWSARHVASTGKQNEMVPTSEAEATKQETSNKISFVIDENGFDAIDTYPGIQQILCEGTLVEFVNLSDKDLGVYIGIQASDTITLVVVHAGKRESFKLYNALWVLKVKGAPEHASLFLEVIDRESERCKQE